MVFSTPHKTIIHFALCGAGAGLAVALGFGSAALAQSKSESESNFAILDHDKRLTALDAQAMKLDSEDYPYVEEVCTVCHTPEYFLHSRTWTTWEGIFDQMSRYGAKATPEEWKHIYLYFQKTMTDIDVNHADEDELSTVLGVNENTAITMVQRRPFKNLGDVERVPGINKAKIEAMKERVLFDTPPYEE